MRNWNISLKKRNKQFLHQPEERTGQGNFAISSSKYLLVLVVVLTAISINSFYSLAMMFLTTFTLAYLTKGFRSK